VESRTRKIFGDEHDIPSPMEMHMSKLEGAMVTADTCNGARRTSSLIAGEIVKAVKEKIAESSGKDRNVLVLQQDCRREDY